MVATWIVAVRASRICLAASGSKMASEIREDGGEPRDLGGPPRRDGPGDARTRRGGRPEEQRTFADRADLALDELGLAVVARPARSDVEAREPLDPGLLQLPDGLADPLAGDGDVEVVRPRQAQGPREVNRPDDLPRDEGRPEGRVGGERRVRVLERRAVVGEGSRERLGTWTSGGR